MSPGKKSAQKAAALVRPGKAPASALPPVSSKIVVTLSRHLEAEFGRGCFTPAVKKNGTRASSYWTNVLPKEQLRQKLHEAVVHARARLGDGASPNNQT